LCPPPPHLVTDAHDPGGLPFARAGLAGPLENPANDTIYRIQIWPKEAIDRDSFSVAVVDLHKQKLLPDALHLLSPNGKDMQRYYFTTGKVVIGKVEIGATGKILPNEPINDVNFAGKPWPNWKVVVNPAENAPPAVAGPGPRVNPQPALRPAAPARRR